MDHDEKKSTLLGWVVTMSEQYRWIMGLCIGLPSTKCRYVFDKCPLFKPSQLEKL